MLQVPRPRKQHGTRPDFGAEALHLASSPSGAEAAAQVWALAAELRYEEASYLKIIASLRMGERQGASDWAVRNVMQVHMRPTVQAAAQLPGRASL